MYYYSPLLVLLLFTAATSANPISKRRTPSSRSILAALEGLPPCVAKCMISEAHWGNHDSSVFVWVDYWKQDKRDWCDNWSTWKLYHLNPCYRANCDTNDWQLRDNVRAWRDKNCG
ncbi:hypothetical protein CONLIGDRAFT_713305 [Coniochaeta ligniaria NRRL 30616]|uniref:Uncharacterized protein n=1 Tax=Coniochaeta ligniaria NRRL 30616 TaxID=1408157 RepID=A0A1J7JSK7_9PEZI|nr:hypothetical protein CONLIGDRAFT_713305 [Coniochaeta ligniaria NRRL 30616]